MALDDGVKLVSGSVPLATTTALPEDAVFLGVARSQLSNASSVSIDETSVLEQPGILRFISGRDFADAFGKTLFHNGEPLLAMGDVSYQGQPVGLVVANDQHAALSARRFVSAIGDQRDHVTNIDGLQQPFDAKNCNNELITGHWKVRRGDVAAAFRSADEVLRSTYYSEPASQVPLEPHCVVVQEIDGQILVRSSTQAPYWAKRDIGIIRSRDAPS